MLHSIEIEAAVVEFSQNVAFRRSYAIDIINVFVLRKLFTIDWTNELIERYQIKAVMVLVNPANSYIRVILFCNCVQQNSAIVLQTIDKFLN